MFGFGVSFVLFDFFDLVFCCLIFFSLCLFG